MIRHSPCLAPLMALAVLAGVAGCAPANGNSTVSPYALGTAGYVSYGTVVGMRPVQVSGTRSGVGAAAGAVGGGLVGSTVGRGWRARTVGGVAGAVIGGVGGALVEEAVTSGQAVEFIVRTDRGPDIAVIQTNELGLRPGDRVAITQGDRVRLTRAADVPAPAAYAPGYAPMRGK